MEGRLREGISFFGLAISMGGSKEEGLPGGVDQMDEAMCDISLFLNVIEWAANRSVDSATERDQTRVSISSNVVRPCSRCLI